MRYLGFILICLLFFASSCSEEEVENFDCINGDCISGGSTYISYDACISKCSSNNNNNNNNNNTVTTGVFTDSRDGKEYQVKLINGLWWMMENFEYDYQGSASTSKYWDGGLCDKNGDNSINEKCDYTYYDNKSYDPSLIPNVSNSGKGGLLYTYDAARGAAPSGWRLPSSDEWNDMDWGDTKREIQDGLLTGGVKEVKDREGVSVPQQLLGIQGIRVYHSTNVAWTSTEMTIDYPNGDLRDWYRVLGGGSNGVAHYEAIGVRYVIEEGSFTP